MEIVDTKLGRFSFAATRTGGCPISLQQISLQPMLPPGMSVISTRAILLTTDSCDAISTIRFTCNFEGEADGGPCTGEGLDAQEWEDSGYLVVVGTEDADFLGKRIPLLGLGELDPIVQYEPRRLSILVEDIPPNCPLSLHYVIAENFSPEPVEISAWFAVDIPHHQIQSNALQT